MNEIHDFTVEQELERYKRWLKDLRGRYYDLIAVPTADEVCEALREWFKKQEIDNDGIKYDRKYKAFVNGSFILVNYIDDMLLFEVLLPPYLVTLISRFYEGVGENG